jgi:hypothetical protein
MKKLFTLLLFLFTHLTNGQIPTLGVDQIRGLDTTQGGCSDYDSLAVRTIGVIHGKNFGQSNNRIQISLIDKRCDTLLFTRAGIGIFKAQNDLPVSLNEGDSVIVRGLVTCFNGLSQINIDSLLVLKTNAKLVEPRVIPNLDETSESYLVKLLNMEFIPTSWPASPSGSGFTAKAFRGTPGTIDYQEFDIRIDNDCDLFGQPVPTGKVDIVGIGGQFDSSIPRDSRYQLSPRSSLDITPSQPLVLPVINFVGTTYTVQEGTAVSIPLSISSSSLNQVACLIESMDSTGIFQDYTIQEPSLVTFPANVTDNSQFNFTVNSDSLVEGEEVFFLKLKKIADNYNIGSDSIMKVIITDNTPASVKQISNLTISPNPVGDFILIKSNQKLNGEVKVVNYFGQEVYKSDKISNVIPMIGTLPGLYKIIFKINNQRITKTIIKE